MHNIKNQSVSEHIPSEHVQIVSAPFPSGVTWLINVLLELNLRVTSHGAFWKATPQGYIMEPPQAYQNLLWHLPILHKKRFFHFENSLEIFWEHRFDFCQYPQRKTILFVRDPRDAVYSYFRRLVYGVPEKYQDTTECYLRFLTTPDVWPAHFPGMLDFSPPNTIAYFYLFWLKYVPQEQLKIIRFEDTKKDPLGQLKEVLNFLNLSFDQKDLENALESSDIKQAQKITKEMSEKTKIRNLSSRAGLPFEWEKNYTPQTMACFCGPVEKALKALNYPPLPEGIEKPCHQIQVSQSTQEIITHFRTLLAEHRLEEAEYFACQYINYKDKNFAGNFLSGVLLLSLRWCRAILGNAQYDLPQASRIAQIFLDLNLEFITESSLRHATTKLVTSYCFFKNNGYLSDLLSFPRLPAKVFFF